MEQTMISKLVEAQNRTTHAARAIAVFLIYSTASSILGGLVWGISYAVALQSSNLYGSISSASNGITLGLLVAGLGYVVAFIASASELSRSKVRNLDVSSSIENEIANAKGWS